MSEEVRIAVLEQKLSDFSNIVSRIDNAIEKISEVNYNITKMLAVHEEKLEQCNKTDDLTIKIIDDYKEEVEKDNKVVHRRIDGLEDKVSEIDKIKWMTVGCGVVLALLTTAVSTLASGWWSPSETQVQRQVQQNVPGQ